MCLPLRISSENPKLRKHQSQQVLLSSRQMPLCSVMFLKRISSATHPLRYLVTRKHLRYLAASPTTPIKSTCLEVLHPYLNLMMTMMARKKAMTNPLNSRRRSIITFRLASMSMKAIRKLYSNRKPTTTARTTTTRCSVISL